MRIDVLQQGAVAVIRLDGLMTHENLSQVEVELTERSETGQPRILLDMSRVPLLDSAAMNLLLDLQDNSSYRGGVVKLVGLTPLCREILEITGVFRKFEVFDNQIAAIGSFAA